MARTSLDEVINHFIDLADCGDDVMAQEVAEALLELKRRREEDDIRAEQTPVSIGEGKQELIKFLDELISAKGEELKENPDDDLSQLVYEQIARTLVGVQQKVGEVFSKIIPIQ